MKPSWKEPALVAGLVLLLFVPGVTGVPDTIYYNLGPDGLEVTAGVFTLKVMDDDGPLYSFYDNVENETEHHINLLRAFEYVDENLDGVFSANSDTAVSPSVSFQTSGWSFGGFLPQESGEETIGLQFNLSSVNGFTPHQTHLQVTLQNSVDLQNKNCFRLNFIVKNWQWSRQDTSLAMVIAFGTASRGQQMQRPEVHQEPNNLTFSNGYFSYDSPVSYGQTQVDLNASLGGATSQGDGEQVALCLPHFGNDTLEFSPVIGLIQASSIPSPTQTTTALLGTERLLILSAGVSGILAILVILKMKQE